VTDRSRIKRLLVVPVIASCRAHRTGEWWHENIKPIKIKKHKRLVKSYLKYGLDWLRDNLLKSATAVSSALQPFLQAIDNIQPVQKV